MRTSTASEVGALWRALRIATSSRTNRQAAEHLLVARRTVEAELSRPVELSDQAGGDWTCSWSSPAVGGGEFWHLVRLSADDIAQPWRIVVKVQDQMGLAAVAGGPVEPADIATLN